jgi:outer membrane protein assembly factor BamB
MNLLGNSSRSGDRVCEIAAGHDTRTAALSARSGSNLTIGLAGRNLPLLLVCNRKSSAQDCQVNGVVYVGSYDGTIYALNARTGALL